MSKKPLDKKCPLALVTGATKGIGLAIAEMLARRGCHVIGSYFHDDEAAAKATAAMNGKLTLVKSDLSEPAGISGLVREVERLGGNLRYLVPNLGLTDKTPFGQISLDKWNRVLGANLTVPFFLVQELFPYIPDTAGRIVFIGATMGICPHPMSFSYGSSKAGLHFLAQCLVKIAAPRGITVNVVAPGFVDTAMQADKAPDHRARVERKIALRRFGTPEEVASAVESLLDQAYVTGQIVRVDGGYDFE